MRTKDHSQARPIMVSIVRMRPRFEDLERESGSQLSRMDTSLVELEKELQGEKRALQVCTARASTLTRRRLWPY